jgi:EAL domain-containing protein (putative c-di-GMP-specific phosphodiesterase class I)
MLSAREDDTVARIGGDEFLVLLDGHADAAECARVAQRMLAAIAAPFEVAKRTVRIACSIGIARLDPGADAGRLIANADAAMYAAKRAGGSTFSFFEDHMVVDTSEQLSLLGDLRRALELQQFELYYQPKIDARRQRISGVEALLRWNHPRLGVVDPADFMAAAERGGLLASLGRWMLEEACRQAAAWRAQGRELRVAVQFSAPQLGDGSLVANVAEALRRHGLPASQLLCEITESAAMQDVKATMRVFEGLLALGVQLSIDEFGSACSSLNQLKELPARQLKIDRRFVHELERAQDARALVESIIRLAHGLQLTVVAEGVETAGQRDILVKMGCDELQGFLYARPMQASAMQSWSLEAPEPRSRTFAPRPSHDAAQASA